MGIRSNYHHKPLLFNESKFNRLGLSLNLPDRLDIGVWLIE